MTTVQSTYLGWEQPLHRTGCKRPVWDIDVRREDGAYRYHGHSEPRLAHSCPEECCDHANSFTRVTVRIVCRSCGVAELVTGEHTTDTGHSITSTTQLGYGLAPRKVAGLFLWAGEPYLTVGRAGSDEPHDFLVTATRVDRVTQGAVVGQITQWHGKRGGVIWTASALPDPHGPYGHGLGRIRWNRVQEGFKTVAAAAKWIAASAASTGEGPS
ncbi:hypothetical protein ACIO6T_41255 [Streptomyces sp. NPDC087532]|uniref:hypothetical protein n=1 Tax=unclassified Streptomyces TaxID=2593676 RepID=UPI0034309483